MNWLESARPSPSSRGSPSSSRLQFRPPRPRADALRVEASTAFLYDIVLHLGTALAALAYYRCDVARVLGGCCPRTGRRRRRCGRRGACLLLLLAATVPTAAIGLTFKEFFEGLFAAPRGSRHRAGRDRDLPGRLPRC